MRVNWRYHDLEITLLIIQDKLNTKFAKSEIRVIENSDFCDIQRGDLMLTNDNNVRRNDLSLRLKYIGIKTRIFKIAPFKYVILCSNIPDDFEKIKTYFDRSIRYVTLQISLSDQVPEHYIEELSPIDMEHPVDDFRATARTRAEIEEYIYGRYHDFDIRKIVPSEGGINFHMDIYVGSDVSDKQIARLQKERIRFRYFVQRNLRKIKQN